MVSYIKQKLKPIVDTAAVFILQAILVMLGIGFIIFLFWLDKVRFVF